MDDNNANQKYYEQQKINKLAKKIGQEKFQNNSRNRLMDAIKKKFDTTMIGALAAFEEEFGELWGNGLDIHDLDRDQLEERERWERVRSKVLDNGNDQARSAAEEISNYTVSLNRYVTKFIVKPHN